jgi:hypothetical protein
MAGRHSIKCVAAVASGSGARQRGSPVSTTYIYRFRLRFRTHTALGGPGPCGPLPQSKTDFRFQLEEFQVPPDAKNFIPFSRFVLCDSMKM